MLVEHQGRRPQVAPTAYVAPNAVVSGDVVVGNECRILFGDVVTAEGGRVEFGEQAIVMERAVVRGRKATPPLIGRHADEATILRAADAFERQVFRPDPPARPAS